MKIIILSLGALLVGSAQAKKHKECNGQGIDLNNENLLCTKLFKMFHPDCPKNHFKCVEDNDSVEIEYCRKGKKSLTVNQLEKRCGGGGPIADKVDCGMIFDNCIGKPEDYCEYGGAWWVECEDTD